MILTDDRRALDDALAQAFSVCVLLGTEDSDPGKVHGCLEGDWGALPWQRWFLVTDPDLLSAEEWNRWFVLTDGQDDDEAEETDLSDQSIGDFAFLGRQTKERTSVGWSVDELLIGGACDFIMYLDKFAEADLQ